MQVECPTTFRPNTRDQGTTPKSSCRNAYRLPPLFEPDDVIVDVGDHIGVFPGSEIDAIRDTKGIVKDESLPLAVKHVKFKEDFTGFKERASATRQDGCVMMGVDPEKAFGGDEPMFEFAEGTPQEALAKMKKGRRYSLVPDHFRRDTGLGVGDKFSVVPFDDPEVPIEYEIAGVVSMPGWHWMTKMGFRRGRAAGLTFSPYEDVRQDFDTGDTTLLWMNMDDFTTEDEIKAALQPIAERNFGNSSFAMG